MSYAIWQNSRLYAVAEGTIGTAGTFTSTTAMRYTQGDLDWQAAILTPNNKTGTRSQSRYAPGRRKGTWNVVLDLAGSGAAGTKPDADPFWVGVFGQAGVAVASTSYTYSISDATPSISIAEYKNNPTTLNHKISIGALVREMKLAFGGDFANTTFSGDAWWTLDSNSFSVATVTEKGGLGSFPAEPGSQTYSGTEIVGFTGSISIDSNVIAEIREGTITMTTGNTPVEDTFGSYYPNGAFGVRRKVTLDINSYDTDSTGQTDMLKKATTQTPIVVTVQFGTVAGNILTATLGRVILAAPKAGQNSDRFTNAYTGCDCLATTDTSKDEIVAVWT